MSYLRGQQSMNGFDADQRGESPAGRNRFRAVARIVVVLAVLVAGVVSPISASPAAASGRYLEVVGGGWGHGRGMSQYGAYGYVQNHGWNANQVLDHYYGGTTMGQYPGGTGLNPERLRVDLRRQIGYSTRVQLGTGSILVSDGAGSDLGSYSGAVRVWRDGSGFAVQTASSCDGPWTTVRSTTASRVVLKSSVAPAGRETLLQVCGSIPTWYEGEIWSQVGAGYQRTINVVSVEQYLRGVVPNEMPASWPHEALKAQAVAARSYVLAGDPRRGEFSDTCDDIYCQVYDGRYTTRGGYLRSSTDARSDAAIVDTKGLVRRTASGGVARTEFSSSTGGWTAGGDFPAVEDKGDAISANPNHRWRALISPSVLESWYGRGRLNSIEVTARNGQGPYGGRVVTLNLVFEGGTVALSGDDLRRRLGLKSTLFTISEWTPDPDSVPHAAEIKKAYKRYLDRLPTGDELTRNSALISASGMPALTASLVDHPEFSGRLVDELYVAALGRDADASGRQYWVHRMQNGLRYEMVGTFFFGSTEYYRRSGGTNETFVRSLYREILGRDVDQEGLNYWLEKMEAGVPPSVVAHSFYRSIESRRSRVTRLSNAILGRGLGAAKVDELAKQLLTEGDLAVAASLGLMDH